MDSWASKIGFFYVKAMRDPAGNVTGAWSSWFDAPGKQQSGRVTCFRIVGRKAWMGGVIEKSNNSDQIGYERVWVIEDNGPVSQAGVGDRFSLPMWRADLGFTQAEEFCEQTPLTTFLMGPILLNDVISGSFTIRNDGAVPPPPPDPPLSEIAYAAWPDGGIRVMSSGASGGRALTSVRGDFQPAWSPDGQWIAFERHDSTNGTSSLYLMRRDGSALRRLGYGSEPAWSPDGKSIAYNNGGPLGIIDVASGIPAKPTGYFGAHPSWSPDGTRIAFAGGYGDQEGGPVRVLVGRADGSGVLPVTADTMRAWNPAWSPDGGTIVFQGDDGIFLVAPDGSGLRRLTYGGQFPAWSPDSRVIVYDDYGLKFINVDGSGMSYRAGGFTPAWSNGPMPPMPKPELSIEILSGNDQSDTVDARLAQAHAVRVRRADGSPAVGIGVNFLPNIPGRLRYDNAWTVTNGAGLADIPVTLGAIPGVVTARAMLTNGLATTPGVLFRATVKPGLAIRLEPTLEMLREPLDEYVGAGSAEEISVWPLDRRGNTATGSPVAWRVVRGAASLSRSVDTTRQDVDDPSYGTARTTVTFGVDEGPVEIEAQLPSTSGTGTRVLFATKVVSKVVRLTDRATPDPVNVDSGKTVAWLLFPRSDDDWYHDLRFEDDPDTSYTTIWSTRLFTGAPRAIRYRCVLHTTDFTGAESGVVIIH